MGKSNSRNQPKEARPEKIRHPNALRKFFNRFRRKHRVEIPNISQNIQENSTAIELTEFDSSILEAYEPDARGLCPLYSAEAIIALNYLHSHGFIHRDVKLENILVNNDGHIKLADYGACREEGPDQNYRSNVGTKMYKAPEFIQDLDYNKAVDFWAIGTVIFELLVGFHPFLPQETCENEDHYIKEAIIHKPIEIPRYLSYRAYSILRAFLKRDPEQRLGSNKEFGYADIQLHPFYYNSFSFYENQPKEARPEKIRHPNALRKFFNRFRRKHRVEIPNISQNIQEESTAIELTEFDSSILEAYEPVKLLGEGGFGQVFLVKDKINKEPFALKIIEKYTDYEEDYQIEKKVLGLSIGFPFLIGLVASFETDERAYVLMDLVRGKDLYYYSKQMGRMPEDYARFYSAEAIIALNYLHSHGFIHRDVKLENILVNNDGHIKLADYGACREEGPDQNYRSNVGTKMYKAPEFIQDLDYNKAVDFWAIGTVIFELLLGFHPFLPQETCENEDHYIKEAIIHNPIEIPRYLSYGAYSILRAFLKRDPEQRLGSNKEFGYADIQLHPFYYNSFSFYERIKRQSKPRESKSRQSKSRSLKSRKSIIPTVKIQTNQIPESKFQQIKIPKDRNNENQNQTVKFPIVKFSTDKILNVKNPKHQNPEWPNPKIQNPKRKIADKPKILTVKIPTGVNIESRTPETKYRQSKSRKGKSRQTIIPINQNPERQIPDNQNPDRPKP
ncbi:hypothetical protein LAZ67_7002359 [Cordylochernes scorpioides]|uniref:Protein kinase domain-containing protein n=1 Tax=Cordylochernes scorpioides TaxID=51811 RepID=A0ABY6KRR8_9ARAC|nr:hypothetical protein LAZ67_7002359 [Cordylochernes scorpioides]